MDGPVFYPPANRHSLPLPLTFSIINHLSMPPAPIFLHTYTSTPIFLNKKAKCHFSAVLQGDILTKRQIFRILIIKKESKSDIKYLHEQYFIFIYFIKFFLCSNNMLYLRTLFVNIANKNNDFVIKEY